MRVSLILTNDFLTQVHSQKGVYTDSEVSTPRTLPSYTNTNNCIFKHTERTTFKVAMMTYRALHGSAPSYLASSFTCVADMPHRRTLRSASTERLDVPTEPGVASVNSRRSCFSSCWCKGVEWPAKRCDISFVACSVQEQA